MMLYNCPRCGMASPHDRTPPPGAICYPCRAEARGKAWGTARQMRALQEAHAALDPRFARHDDPLLPAADDAELGAGGEE